MPGLSTNYAPRIHLRSAVFLCRNVAKGLPRLSSVAQRKLSAVSTMPPRACRHYCDSGCPPVPEGVCHASGDSRRVRVGFRGIGETGNAQTPGGGAGAMGAVAWIAGNRKQLGAGGGLAVETA